MWWLLIWPTGQWVLTGCYDTNTVQVCLQIWTWNSGWGGGWWWGNEVTGGGKTRAACAALSACVTQCYYPFPISDTNSSQDVLLPPPPINYIWFKTKPMVVDGMYGQWIVIYCPITDAKCSQDVSPSSMYLDFHCVRTNGISFHFRHLYCSQDVWSAGQKSYGVLLPQCQVRLAMIIEFGLTSEPLVRFLKFKML